MKQSPMLRFQEDEVILRESSADKVMYKILSGTAAVYLNHGRPDEYLVGLLSEQRCFGEISILCGKPNIYTVIAVTEVLLLRITEETFDDFIKTNSQNAIDIMKNLANTLLTLSFNINMLTNELGGGDSGRPDAQKIQDITQRIRQCAAVDAVSKGLFTFYV